MDFKYNFVQGILTKEGLPQELVMYQLITGNEIEVEPVARHGNRLNR